MSDHSKIAKNLQAFQMAVNAHDRENPTHNAYGIGLSAFDMDRLGLDEGEAILPGITIHCDAGTSGNFRVLCDGDHDEEARGGRGRGRRGGWGALRGRRPRRRAAERSAALRVVSGTA